MSKRKCLCGEALLYSEQYGPVSQTLLKWYEHGQSFGEPSTRRKFYLCPAHTNEMVKYLDAVASGRDVAVVEELS